MNYFKRYSSAHILLIILLVNFCAGTLLGGRTTAQAEVKFPANIDAVHDQNRNEALTAKASSDLIELAHKRETSTIKAIVQVDDLQSSKLSALLLQNGVRVKKRLRSLKSLEVELPASAVEQISASSEVSYISLNREIRSLGHIETATGVEAMRQINGNSEVDGRGIGIAVIDSSIFNSHGSFLGSDGSRRVVDVKYGSSNLTTTLDDKYGHGTHVASIAAGNTNNAVFSGRYNGIAPDAKIYNLCVLDKDGKGQTSDLLKALDWVLRNHATYNIRVVNLSLGSPAVDSYKNDPVCLAVRQLVNNGVVVVVAAGNDGKSDSGQKVYGRIHSPGNEPSAITVGATNSFGTDVRSDDAIASYSSCGPTRSFWTDPAGVRHYDNLIKPDIVAPGNKLIAAQSKKNEIVRENPELQAYWDGSDSNAMMYLSGTSMAAPIVSGAAALMLQANPKLTPNMVKALLMYTAQPLAGYNMLEQGTGMINIEGAVRLARLVRTDLTDSTPLGSPLLITNTPPTAQTTIAGESCPWAQGIILNHTYATGLDLITQYQKIYGRGMMLGDGILLSNGILLADTSLVTEGFLPGDTIFTSNGILLAGGTPFLSCGDLLGDGSMLADGILLAGGVLAGDGIIFAETFIQSLKVPVRGDDTAYMK
jgi:subtilisin family serine protease